MKPRNLLEKLAKPFLKDHTIILLDRMELYPEEFTHLRAGMWDKKQMAWMDIVRHGVFPLIDLIIVRRRAKQVDIDETRKRILDLLVNGNTYDDPSNPFDQDFLNAVAQVKPRPRVVVRGKQAQNNPLPAVPF